MIARARNRSYVPPSHNWNRPVGSKRQRNIGQNNRHQYNAKRQRPVPHRNQMNRPVPRDVAHQQHANGNGASSAVKRGRPPVSSDPTKIVRIIMLGHRTPTQSSKEYALDIQEELKEHGIRAAIHFLENTKDLNRETDECMRLGYSYLLIADDEDIYNEKLGMRTLMAGFRKEQARITLDDAVNQILDAIDEPLPSRDVLERLRDKLRESVGSTERKPQAEVPPLPMAKNGQSTLIEDDDEPTDPRIRRSGKRPDSKNNQLQKPDSKIEEVKTSTPKIEAPADGKSSVNVTKKAESKLDSSEETNQDEVTNGVVGGDDDEDATKLNGSTLDTLLEFFENSDSDEDEELGNTQEKEETKSVGLNKFQTNFPGINMAGRIHRNQPPVRPGVAKPVQWNKNRHMAKTQFCRDWIRGKCARGQFCRFKHEQPPGAPMGGLGNTMKSQFGIAGAVQNENQVCRDWIRGRCQRQICRFRHENSNMGGYGFNNNQFY